MMVAVSPTRLARKSSWLAPSSVKPYASCAASPGARQLQALCYQSLVHDSLGQHEAYTENLVQALLPALLTSLEMPAENVVGMLGWYLRGLTDHENIAQLEDGAKLLHGASLATLAQSNPEHRDRLLRASMAFYRGAGDIAAETEILLSIAPQD